MSDTGSAHWASNLRQLLHLKKKSYILIFCHDDFEHRNRKYFFLTLPVWFSSPPPKKNSWKGQVAVPYRYLCHVFGAVETTCTSVYFVWTLVLTRKVKGYECM